MLEQSKAIDESNDRALARRKPRQMLAGILAKVVCQAGEYLCALRDVSELGAGLNFFHAVPPEPRIILQLANGLTYPLERVWIGKRQAGYRFGSDVSVEEFFKESEGHMPRAIRLSLKGSAIVSHGGMTHRVGISNLSCDGLRFESDAQFPLHCPIDIAIKGLEGRLGQLRWHNGRGYGMQFVQPLTHEELSDCALRLQPFGSPFPHLLGDALSKARAA